MSVDPWTVMSSLILEDGRAWADAATPRQLADAREAIEGDCPYSYWTRSRGYAKTSDAAGVALSLLVAAPDGARCYWLAADIDQGTLAIDSIGAYVSRSPMLRGAVEVQARKIVCTAGGATLEVLAADAASSWGIRPHLIVVDEFSAWSNTQSPKRLWESVSSAVAKLPDARLLVVTSAGDPRSLAYEVLEHARTSPLWRTSEAPGPSPWMNPDRLAEQKARLPRPVYQSLFENQWVESAGAFLDAGALSRAFTLPGPSGPVDGRSYIATLDLGLVSDATVLAIAHREGPDVHLDLLTVWQGSKAHPVSLGEVRDSILQAHHRYNLRGLWFDRWQAHRLTEELSEAGVQCHAYEFTSASKQRYSAALLQHLNQGTLALYEPGGLQDELAALTIRTTGGGWSFDHGRHGHDDRAVALAMAVLQLSASAPGRPNYSFSGLPPIYSREESAARARYAAWHDSTGQFGTRHLDLPPRGSGR